jgi:hypothetical protein
VVSQKTVRPPASDAGAATQANTWNSGTNSDRHPSQWKGSHPGVKTPSAASARSSKFRTGPNGHIITWPMAHDRDSTSVIASGQQEAPVALIRQYAEPPAERRGERQIAPQVHPVQAFVLVLTACRLTAAVQQLRGLRGRGDEPVALTVHRGPDEGLVREVDGGAKIPASAQIGGRLPAGQVHQQLVSALQFLDLNREHHSGWGFTGWWFG